ncbi:MAG: ParB/RepB/Spo0J family partition protein [Spirochaetia bacterium]|nr:ParB/RepB/Spo0J family partition protein [Spirochaetia bacterium]
MDKKKSGLGRGLSNLLPGAAALSTHPEYQEIPIGEIQASPDQPRKRFDDAEIQELAKTLHTIGLIEPVIVRRRGNVYQLVSGERRWRACRMAGFKKIPAIVKELTDIQALEMGIVENVQREELTAMEEARAYEQWMGLTGQKPSDLADRVGKDRSTVTNLIRLLKLPPEVQDLIERGLLSAGQARPLLGIGDRKTVLSIAGKIAREGWSARRVEEEVARLQDGGTGKSAGTKKDPNVRHLEDKIRARFTSRVQVAHKKGGAGSITLHYKTLSELDKILDLMGIKSR